MAAVTSSRSPTPRGSRLRCGERHDPFAARLGRVPHRRRTSEADAQGRHLQGSVITWPSSASCNLCRVDERQWAEVLAVAVPPAMSRQISLACLAWSCGRCQRSEAAPRCGCTMGRSAACRSARCCSWPPTQTIWPVWGGMSSTKCRRIFGGYSVVVAADLNKLRAGVAFLIYRRKQSAPRLRARRSAGPSEGARGSGLRRGLARGAQPLFGAHATHDNVRPSSRETFQLLVSRQDRILDWLQHAAARSGSSRLTPAA
jgi:hypothetical protein